MIYPANLTHNHPPIITEREAKAPEALMEEQTKDIASWQLQATEDGIRILDSILWLDARFTPDLSFLSSACQVHGRTPSKIITTEETSRLLAINNIKVQGLVCPYNQTIALGALRMELLPSGSGLGSASLWVEQAGKTLLYAPRLQPQKTGITRMMQLKPAETLILGAFTPFPESHHPSRKKEKERLLQTIQQALLHEQYPILLCEPFAVAAEITQILSDAKIEPLVHQSIYRIHQVYRHCGIDLGQYSLYHKKRRDKRVLMMPIRPAATRSVDRMPLPEGPIFCVEESLLDETTPALLRPVSERFTMSSSSDARELKAVLQSVGAREIFTFGPYAKHYAEQLSSARFRVQALYPSHLPEIF